MLSIWLLGSDWKQRLRIKRSLSSSMGYVVAAVLLKIAAGNGWLPMETVGWISDALLVTVLAFYAVLRSGLNQLFKDASLTMPQMMVAVSHAAAIYTLGGIPRDGILLVMAPVLAFGFHHLRPLQIRLLSGYTLLALGAAMVWLVATQPQTYDMAKELVRFMLLAVIIVMMWQATNHEPQENSSQVQRAMRVVFTDDPKQRLRIQRFLVAAVNFVICTTVLAYAVSTGAVNPHAGTLLSVYMIGQSVLFYVMLRSGFNLRFADPALTMPQIIVAITCVVGAYSILRETRGAALMLLVMVLVFGMFNLTAKQARIAAFFALALQGIVMLGMASLHPESFPVRQELIHFLFACTTLPTISLLAGQLSELRARLKTRKDELATALERIQTLATRDELTGLFNRRHMMEALALQKRFADGGGRVFCIAILDIDLFKRINDQYGHGVGDEVLRNFAQAVQATLHGSDVVARWGGEEFLLMLTDCRADQAQMGLMRVHGAVNALQVSANVPDLRITFSAGLAEQEYAEGIEATIERADRALYRAKHAGRNRTLQA